MSEAYEARVNANRPFNESQPILFSTNEDFDDLDDDFLDMYTMNPRQRLLRQLQKVRNKLIDHFQRLPAWKKFLVVIAILLQMTLTILVLVFHDKILHAMITASKELRARWYTPLVCVLLVFGVSFPPLIGFSLLSVTVGIIYGVSFLGWFILFIGSLSGSISAFVLFKTLLRSQAERLAHANAKFEALASTLQDDDGYWMLALIRLCPFPYSFTNGAIAGIYGVTLKNFSLANVLTSPKLLMYLFIGSRLKNMGEDSSASSRIFDVVSILITGIILALTTWLLYTKAKRRYQEMQRNQSLDASFETVF
ncbi:LADA_0A01090g1_1 [Lachancea dasiensis]|uniref:Golgi apparatus membrane protein TVP38 n=1 Tax=Lachancea dasiensis TaxID=1072105 RepID=A0A1G4ILZ4_9SACH|nr:LADA_0A01090g1_1 [Lachancea dasiensis]